MPSSEIQNINNLMQKAYSAGQNSKAHKLAQKGIELATQINDKKALVNFLFWNGCYLYEFGKIDEAMPYLFKASQYEPEANPADIYSAVTGLIKIFIDKKPFQETQKLINDSYKMLETQMNKIEWRHKLDFLNGNLEFARRNYQKSYEHYATAYHFCTQCSDYPSYPSYTTISHLYALVKTSYYIKDIDRLNKWIKEIDAQSYTIETEKLDIQQSNILYEKIKKSRSNYKLNSLAMSQIETIELFEYDAKEEYKNIIKVFCLTNHFEAVDTYLDRITLENDNFSDLLLLGDIHLAKSRYILKLDSINDEIEDDDINPNYILDNNLDISNAKVELEKAKKHYIKMSEIAKKEDERLETKHYFNTTQNRLDKVQKILNLIKEQHNAK